MGRIDPNSIVLPAVLSQQQLVLRKDVEEDKETQRRQLLGYMESKRQRKCDSVEVMGFRFSKGHQVVSLSNFQVGCRPLFCFPGCTVFHFCLTFRFNPTFTPFSLSPSLSLSLSPSSNLMRLSRMQTLPICFR